MCSGLIVPKLPPSTSFFFIFLFFVWLKHRLDPRNLQTILAAVRTKIDRRSAIEKGSIWFL